ncbi:sensor histidine kinase [Acidicapsa dinghuensis]|uniref:histidine kinase n=1 Tax=Acidicapsa dinghuensis TaxID=2218256 RepID=A0ABW1EAN1_9BACT|nr:ATP-binding protein [Acidicapsa dinghuensis]
MTTAEIVERLIAHKLLGSVSPSELMWLATHGTLRWLDAGEQISVKGMEVRSLNIILSGHVGLFIDRGSGPVKVIEWRAGEVSGMLPYSRLTVAPGNSIAMEPTELLAIERDKLREMTQECYEVTSILVHTMLDRTRLFTSSELHDEKLLSLGKLSAGLAHELNNPAAAIERCAALLQFRISDAEDAARVLARVALSENQVAAIDRLRIACVSSKEALERGPIEQMTREEEMGDWLMANGLDTQYADMLADTDVPAQALHELASQVSGEALGAAVRCAAVGCSIRKLTSMIQEASARISNMVTAVKGFTHMDQANTAETVDLGMHLNNTIAVLHAKAAQKSVEVTLEIEPDLSPVYGFAAELNQVWGNLIDNALDAARPGGKVNVVVVAQRENRRVVVSVFDDGPGVPVDIRDRIFDPFFTTKPMGQGTGLGLDIVRRLLRHNDGGVDLIMHPGQTEFRVNLPVAGSRPA